jgi:hypothetical protein
VARFTPPVTFARARVQDVRTKVEASIPVKISSCSYLGIFIGCGYGSHTRIDATTLQVHFSFFQSVYEFCNLEFFKVGAS